MTKAEAIKLMGLTSCGPDLISLYNFDTRENETWRTVYKDAAGNRWAWIYGEFYRVEKMSQGCRPMESATAYLKAHSPEKYTFTSKEMAAIHDEFDAMIVDAVHWLAERICDKFLDREKLEEAGYDLGTIPEIENLVEPMIKEAYGFTYESDGLGF